MISIVLVEPEIPQNTGNISRTCAVTGMPLILVRPLGFDVSDKAVKRAGLDYWDKVNITYFDRFEDVVAAHPEGTFYYCSTKAKRKHTDVCYEENAFLVFGKETKGLPEELIYSHYDHAVRIPMRPLLRSLNLSNAVAIVAYEALRQHDFFGIE